MTSIALCMIVKNESDVIERCIRSVSDIIDYWVICDTGSTDGTQDLIRRAVAGIPGELHERPWVDFGHNRSELLAYAEGKADYLLLLDADWTFTATAGALENLTADVYFVEHRHTTGNDFSLSNRHLIKGDRRRRYTGVTHEHLVIDKRTSEAKLKGAFILNWGDGGVGREKRWHQDVELLEAALKRDPKNGRHRFYLAQTYRDLGDSKRAIQEYAKRARMGGFDQEVFYALYQVGALHRALGNWAQAVPALIKAYRFRSSRIEPLYQLAAGYRELGEHEMALKYLRRAMKAPLPQDVLFVEQWVYNWGLQFQYSVCAFATGDPETALKITDQLLARADISDDNRRILMSNRDWYLDATPEEQPEVMVGNQRFSVSMPQLGDLGSNRPRR